MMLRLIRNAMLGSGLLLFGLAANAQVNPDRDQYYEHTPRGDQYQRGGSVFDQVRADLDQAIDAGSFGWRERNVLSQAMQDLRAADRAWDQGSYNPREVNEAIAR